jgi:hypothetical protein
MQKPFQLIIKCMVFPLLISLVSCGTDNPEGVYYFSDDARNYQFDTVNSFQMIDNLGITEQFYVDNYTWYPRHYFFDQFGGLYCETFGIAYHSVLNDFFFLYLLKAEMDFTGLRVEWNQKDAVIYNFDENKIISTEIVPDVRFYDSLLVKDVIYSNIIEIDYTDNIGLIDENTPVKTYISGDKGLVKFIRKDGIIAERVPE